jgi:hypothetical protein
MNIFDVLLDTQDIVVLGPPKQVDVSLDIGEKGDRGSKIFVGTGNPNNPGVLPAGENILLGDFFLNVSVGAEFAWLYSYVQTPSGNIWTPAIRLQPSIYNREINSIFNLLGEATISIPLVEISADSAIVDPDRYAVQITTSLYQNPVSLTVVAKTISGENLQIVVKAIEYDSNSWKNLEGDVQLAFNISVV